MNKNKSYLNFNLYYYLSYYLIRKKEEEEGLNRAYSNKFEKY